MFGAMSGIDDLPDVKWEYIPKYTRCQTVISHDTGLSECCFGVYVFVFKDNKQKARRLTGFLINNVKNLNGLEVIVAVQVQAVVFQIGVEVVGVVQFDSEGLDAAFNAKAHLRLVSEHYR